MILGVYWYQGFPSGLYNFDYFVFRKGIGGHGDNPAELETSIEAGDPDKIIDRLVNLVRNRKEASLFIKRDNNLLTISINSYHLFDYDFLVAREVENILSSEEMRFNSNNKFTNAQLIRLENKPSELIYPSKGFFEIVSNHLGQYNAEALSLRLDCNISSVHKKNFIESLNDLTDKLNIEVFYYFENTFSNQTNLMLFFSNGRQGLNFKEKAIVDITCLEENIETLFKKFSIQKGHLGGFGAYPKGEPVIRKSLEW
jgi:hypothetical protein